MNAFTIKDLENLSGIKAHTIRIWEQRYSFLKPQRSDTNIRYYTNDELKTILNIALLNKYGYKISHIDKMSETDMYETIISLSQIEAQQERIVNELIQFLVTLNIEKIEETLDKYIGLKGIEKTITQIIFPFLERIGILWSNNHINPAQEHLVSNVIRQKLIVGIESTISHVSMGKTILLFLPEGEHHELGLLFMYYLLKSRGFSVLYVGANISLRDIAVIAKLKKPDLLYCHLTSIASNFNLEKFIAHLNTQCKECPVVLSGYVIQHYKKKTPPNISLKRSLHEVMDYIACL